MASEFINPPHAAIDYPTPNMSTFLWSCRLALTHLPPPDLRACEEDGAPIVAHSYGAQGVVRDGSVLVAENANNVNSAWLLVGGGSVLL